MKVRIFFVAVCILLGTSAAFGAEVQRYQVVESQLRESSGIGPITILVDTATGKTWYLTSGLYWNPIMIAHKIAKPFEDAKNGLGMTYEPER